MFAVDRPGGEEDREDGGIRINSGGPGTTAPSTKEDPLAGSPEGARKEGKKPQAEEAAKPMTGNPRNLEDLLGLVEDTVRSDCRVSVGEILDAVGRRSFGPLVLLVGVITLAPIVGDIPGVPTMMGVLLLLVAGQILLRKDHIWLPRKILSRSVSREKLCKAIGVMRKPARWADRWIRPRVESLTLGAGFYVVAVTCTLIALLMPFMELIPFSANGAGVALTAFGLALIANDGLLMLVALLATVGTSVFVVYQLM